MVREVQPRLVLDVETFPWRVHEFLELWSVHRRHRSTTVDTPTTQTWVRARRGWTSMPQLSMVRTRLGWQGDEVRQQAQLEVYVTKKET